ncbi:tripartite tricarboxylate transporter TctB family protein [Chelativorans sp. AA-79]|uniref:tripartite tricarboxylate transporter TctB family protein n=1 Tax=Chelativorans sp. AA-79 TaxID=3028735 RepID=UPI0023F697CA|nr:tripartite tricarboxylate transporter TctB family protein [Chelativorans sp. AA-79]WEX09035.1 tripartite tricarboxylate transporter TctB family protein [Chelativorans sp. AA-79]
MAIFRSRSPYDIVGGLLLAGVGLLVVVQSMAYPIGGITRMGPGYFPLIAGLLLTVLGILIFLFTDDVEGEATRLRLRVFGSVFGSILAWGALVEPFGLVPATVALVAIAAFAHPSPNLQRVAITALALPILGWALFIEGLGLPVEAFAW